MKISLILAVCAQLKQFRPDFFSGFNFTAAYVVCITAMINYIFILIHDVPLTQQYSNFVKNYEI